MKKYILFSILTLLINFTFAQTAPPNGMIYQAVARDGSGNLAVNRTIHVQTTVLRGSATGTVMYADEHKVSSNADAMFTVIVGQGKYLSGTYSKLTDIPWDKDKYFFNLKICVAPTLPRFGWTPSYTDMGTTQFWSVPYAMFSGKSGDSLTLTVNGTGRQIKLGNYKPIFFSVADNDSVSTNEIQTLSRTGGRLLLSLNGGMVTLPDSSATNELQTITRTGGRIILNQNGGTIFLPDSSATNELQTISKAGNTVTLSQGGGSFTDDDKQTLSTSGSGSTKTLSISNGNSVQINVNDADSSTTNELQTLSRTGGRIQLSQSGGIVTLPDSSATNELQTVSISAGKGRITLSNGGGNVVLNDSSGTNELQTINRTGGRIILNQNGGTVTLPDSSATNELQTISQSGNTITLSQSGGSVTITDNDKQQLGITSSKGTISLSNGGSVQLADSSATNELQTISQSGNTIMLSQSGGSVTITDNDKQQLGITTGKGTITLSNGGSVQLADSSATNELQTVSISAGRGRITLSNGGGNVLLNDSSASNELQTMSRTGGRITLNQSGGTVTLPDSSATNELQTVSISAGKGRITLSNGGGNVVLNDSSASNELQTMSRTGGRIILNQSGGTVSLPDSSATNELQTISQSGNTITLSQSGGSVTITDNDNQQLGITGTRGTITLSNGGSVRLADSSATNELQSMSRNGGRITLTQSGGTVTLPDSSATNELQTLSISNDTLSISNGNKIKLPSSSGSAPTQGVRLGFSTNTTWTCPAGVTSITVELWAGAGGSGGSGAAIAWWGPSGCAGCLVGGAIRGGRGASGGNGGYNVAKITVVPGNSYFIKVGSGGTGGSNGTVGGNRSGGAGGNGDTSKFGNLLSALPGTGGGGGISIWGTSTYSCSDGAPGVSGNSTNYKPINVQIQGINQPRGFIPVGYINSTINASCCAVGGSEPQWVQTGTGGVDGYPGNAGESGYCVIHY